MRPSVPFLALVLLALAAGAAVVLAPLQYGGEQGGAESGGVNTRTSPIPFALALPALLVPVVLRRRRNARRERGID